MSSLTSPLRGIRSLAVQTVPKALLLPLLASILFLPLSAQTTGTILGRVADPTGAVVVNAIVKVENVDTGLVREATTGTEGLYLIPSLPIGTYRLHVESSGFKSFSQTGIVLQVGQNARVDVPLVVGAVTESVEVSGGALAVDTQGSTMGAVVDDRRLVSMPLNTRDVYSLAQLLPGVGQMRLETVNTYNRDGAGFYISGSRAGENNVMLDGTQMVMPWLNQSLNLPSPDTLQEFRILTNTYSAEYGRAAGGVFLATTKSGTNGVHGSLWEFLRNDALNARNFFAGSKPFLRQNQFGASAGGPIVRNRTFVFASYQGLRIRKQTLSTDFPPNAAERTGDFSALLPQPVRDPATGQPFPGNIIPPGRFDPLAKQMMTEYVPLPNQPDGSLLLLRSQPTTSNQYTVKVDHNLRDSDRLTFRLFRTKDTGGNIGGGIAESLAGSSSGSTQTWTVNETHIFSPTLLNEFGASYIRSTGTQAQSPANKTPQELGAVFRQDGTIPLTPSAEVSGRFTIGPQFPMWDPNDMFQYDDKLSWIRGRHLLKAGVLLARHRHLSRSQWRCSGDGAFDGSFTGNAVADYLLGRPISFAQYSLTEDNQLGQEYNLYVQDDVKVTHRLTLNLGLRYELYPPWVQRFDVTATLRVGEQSKKFPAAPPGLVFPGDPGVPRGLRPTDKNNFAPRFGFAWDVFGNGRTAIRGAYGVFYSYPGSNITAGPNQIQPYILSLSMPSPPSFSNPYGGPGPMPYKVDPNNFGPYPLVVVPTSAVFRDGYVQQWNFNVQQQYGASLFLEAGYVGNVGHKLANIQEINAARWAPGATEDNVQARRPILPQYYSNIYEWAANRDSNYHSLQASVDKRFSHGYTVGLAYTFSKSIDNRGFDLWAGCGVQDASCLRCDRGPSDYNQKHILAVNGVWELPLLKGRGPISAVLGGWQLSGFTRIRSGMPVNVTSGADYALVGPSGLLMQRPDVVGDGRLDPGRPRGELVNQYFNTAAFVPNYGHYGNSGRNSLEGPGFSQTDLGIQKRFHLPRERLGRIEFRGEIFNLFNQVNFGNPSSTLGSPGFGRILSAQDPRIVQFGLRYDF